jgi:hypothetical protein
VKAPPSVLAWNTAWFVDLASVVGGAAKVGTVAPSIAILTLEEWLAVFHIVVVAVTPSTVEDVVAGTVGPGVVEVVVGMVDLVVGHVGKGRCAVNDSGGNTCVGIGIT